MDGASLAAVAARRSELYWLFAELVLTSPDEAFVARLRSDIARVVDAMGSDSKAAELSSLGDALAQAANAEGVTALAVEYTRLFGGVKAGYGLPPPYESMHRSAAPASEIGLAVTRHYSSAGLDPAVPGSPPDHLGVELKFLSLLCYSECSAWRDGRKTDALKALAGERSFLGEHLLQWAPHFCKKVLAESRNGFFRELAKSVQIALDSDRAMIDQIYLAAEAL